MAKEYRKLGFTDNFMFCKVVSNNPELCRHMLELILDRKIKSVDMKETEKVIDITPGAKSIRMDVYLDDDAGTVYDLEMQAFANKNLPKRLRYYQGVIDLSSTVPIYVFENRCEAMPALLLGDETKKIFVNPYGECEGLQEGTVNFLEYIRNCTVNDTFTEKLERAVEKARDHKEWEVEYMNWRAFEMDVNIDKRIAREEGLAEGRAAGLAEGAYKNLIQQTCKKKKKGLSPEDAADQLESDVKQVRYLYGIIDSLGDVDDTDAIYSEVLKLDIPVISGMG